MIPKKIFFSYSQKDRALLEELLTFLFPLIQNGMISPWDDSKVAPGELWDKEIKKQLSQAELILMLVTADYLANDYITNIQIPLALQRRQKEEVIIVPIILSPCLWEVTALKDFASLPKTQKYLSKFPDRTEGWQEIVEGLQKLIKENSLIQQQSEWNFNIGDFTKDINKDPQITKDFDIEDPNKYGYLLHYIPRKMQYNNLYRCIIRIAFEEESLKVDLPKSKKNIEIKDNVRITDSMEVSFESTEHFKVKNLSSPKQVIEAFSPTQWDFDVRPLTLGKFPLTFKVSAILPDGVKMVVLTEQVNIVSEPVKGSLEEPTITKIPIEHNKNTIYMNPVDQIIKAIYSANLAEAFRLLDEMKASGYTFNMLKQKFVMGNTDWQFPQMLETYARSLDFEKTVKTYAKSQFSNVEDSDLEKLIGTKSNIESINWLYKAIEASKSVCRIVRADGIKGTGFVLKGGYLLTNQHVIENKQIAQKAKIEFNYELDETGSPTEPVTYYLDTDTEDMKSSPNHELDYTYIKIKDNPSKPLSQWGFLELDLFSDPQIGDPAIIIQHPNGRRKEITFRNNNIISVWNSKLFYLTDTLTGSSGAPVFNKEWKVIALHHKGKTENGGLVINAQGDKAPSNEGILIKDILKHIQEQ